MKAIEYIHLTKQFDNAGYKAVNDVSAVVNKGEFITILGSSGCGKTTLLKMTNRLYEPTEGRIEIFGNDISQTDPVKLRRRMGYVIQQVGLFPHLTVEDNIAVPMQLNEWDEETIRKRTEEMLELVRLNPSEFAGRYPSQLSGGQQQRVGLARALSARPQIMLLDEPFGAIDAITRLNLQNEIKRIHKDSDSTFLFVTHDINEAFRLGNRVMIMNEGKLVQFDCPENIVKNPADSFVKTLLDSVRSQERLWEGE